MSSKVISFPTQGSNTTVQKITPKKFSLLVIGAAPEFSADSTAYDTYKEFKTRQEMEASYIAVVPAGERDVRSAIPMQQYSADDENAMTFINIGMNDLMVSQRVIGSFVSSFGNDLKSYINSVGPDVVHVWDLSIIGSEIIPLIKFHHPSARIIISLNSFETAFYNSVSTENLLAGKADCQVLKKANSEMPASVFKIRQSLLQAHLSLADKILVPNEKFKKLYSDWGINAAKIQTMPYVSSNPKIEESAEDAKSGIVVAWYSKGAEREIISLIKANINSENSHAWRVKIICDKKFDRTEIVNALSDEEKNKLAKFVEFELVNTPMQNRMSEIDMLWLVAGTPYFLFSLACNAGKPVVSSNEIAEWYGQNFTFIPARLNNISSISSLLKDAKVSSGKKYKSELYSNYTTDLINTYSE